ncbi:hypothetical protein D1007_07024 [Hordeum vulgare]|nr:hypothetical protein D1007_07024 [Hordeum vulgare]
MRDDSQASIARLLLVFNKEFRCLRINSPNLISIAIRCDRGKLTIKDVHSLQRLLHDSVDTWLQITIVSAPKLDTLGKISDLSDESKIVFGSTVIQATGWHERGLTNEWCQKHQVFSKSHGIYLKTITLAEYEDTMPNVEFLRFFIQNGSILQTIKLKFLLHKDFTVKFYKQQVMVLQMHKSASRQHVVSLVNQWKQRAMEEEGRIKNSVLLTNENLSDEVNMTDETVRSKIQGPGWTKLMSDYDLRQQDIMIINLDGEGLSIRIDLRFSECRGGLRAQPKLSVALDELNASEKEYVNNVDHTPGFQLSYRQMGHLVYYLFNAHALPTIPFVHRVNVTNIKTGTLRIPSAIVRTMKAKLEYLHHFDEIGVKTTYSIRADGRMEVTGFSDFVEEYQLRVGSIVLITIEKQWPRMRDMSLPRLAINDLSFIVIWWRTSSINTCNKIVGVVVEYTNEAAHKQKAALIQLSVGKTQPVLLFQLSVVEDRCKVFDNFFLNSRYTFAGFSIDQGIEKLERVDLQIAHFVDIQKEWRVPGSTKYMDSLGDVSSMLIDDYYMSMKQKLTNTNHKRWACMPLFLKHVQYAAKDAYAVYEIWSRITVSQERLRCAMRSPRSMAGPGELTENPDTIVDQDFHGKERDIPLYYVLDDTKPLRGVNCGVVEWVDKPWPLIMQRCLLKLWQMFHKGNDEHNEQKEEINKLKKDMEELNLIPKDLEKKKNQLDNDHERLMSIHACLSGVVRNIEEDRDEIKMDRDFLQQEVSMLKGNKKKMQTIVSDLVDKGYVNWYELLRIKEILEE